MSFKELNDNKITVETGISNGLIGKGRKRGALSQDTISKILYTYEDLDANWLLTGRGEMLITKEKIRGSSGVVPHTSEQDFGVTLKNTPLDLKALTDLTTHLSEQNIDLATQLGQQINENKHLYNENMQLRAEIEKLKEKKGKKMPELPAKTYENKGIGGQSFAAEPEARYK